MVDISQLTDLISALRAETVANSVSPERVGYVLQRLTEIINERYISLINAIKGFVLIESVDDLPAEPTAEQRMKGYLLGTMLYVWVGENGDTLDGKYQSAQLRGTIGPKGEKGDSGVSLGEVVLVNDLTTGGEEIALSAEMGKRLGEDVYTDEMLTPALVSEQNAFLISNKGAKYANNSFTLNTYAVEPGSVYYIRYTDSVANGNVYQYNWYATEEDAIAGTNGLATIYQRLQAELNLKVTAPDGAHYLNVSFLKTSNYGVYADRYKTKYAEHGRRLDVIEEKLGDLPEEQPIVNLERVNLFDQTKVLEGYIMDGTNGRMGLFTQNGYCYAVAKVPAIKGKYYCIYNPYYNYQRATTKVGALNNNGTSDWGNYNQDNIVLLDSHWIVAQAIWTNGTDIEVDHISFQLYWGPTKPNYQDTPLVEVYEMESAEEAVSWVRAKCGQTMKLSPQVSIDDALLSANVATLGSAYMDKSVVIFGDSISADHAWSEYMMNKLKLRNIFNFGIGGASIQYNRENLDLLSQINDVATRM